MRLLNSQFLFTVFAGNFLTFKAMFDEGRVIDSGALFSRVSVGFSVAENFNIGCCNSLSRCPCAREDFVQDVTLARRPDGTLMQLAVGVLVKSIFVIVL